MRGAGSRIGWPCCCAATYVARARAMTALPHGPTDLTGEGRGWLVPVWHRASPSSNTKRKLAERKIYAAPPEQSKRNNT